MLLFRRIDTWGYLVIVTAMSAALDCSGGEADDLSNAESMFLEGVKLFSSAHYQEALILFEGSYEVHPRANTVFNMAMCNKALMRNQEAIALFEKYLSEYSGDEQMRKDAMAAVDEILRLVGLVELVAVEEGAEISINEQPVGKTPLNQPLVLNPGVYQLSIFLEGYEPYVTSVSISAGARNRIWAKLKQLSEPKASPPPVSPSAAVRIRPRDRLIIRHNLKWAIGVTLGATGVASIGAGVFFSVRYVLNRRSGNQAAETYEETWDEQYELAYHSAEDKMARDKIGLAIGYSVGCALLVGGIFTMLLNRPTRSTDDASKLKVRVGLGKMSIFF